VIVGSGRLIFNSKRRTLMVDANGEPPFIFKGSAEKTKKVTPLVLKAYILSDMLG
jgi:hypothetical protein